jgi:signal transduction histidine kinase
MEIRRHLIGEAEAAPEELSRFDRFRAWLPRVLNLQFKLITPFFTLTLAIAMVGVFVITRLVTSSIKERFSNQLVEASRVTADAVVRMERQHLEDLRLLAFMEGIPEAIEANDAATLQTQLTAMAVNNELEAVSAINPAGREIITITLDLETSDARTYNGADFSTFDPVSMVLSGTTDEFGDKYSALLETSDGYYVFTGTPVRDEQENIVGVLLIGSRLDTLLSDIKLQALADIILLNDDGELLSTTMIPLGQDASMIEPVASELQDGEGGSILEEFVLAGRDYSALFNPLVLRHEPIGVVGVVFPSEYIVSTTATSRDSFSVIFAVGTMAVIALGLFLAQHIARPILQLRAMSQAVASGDLEQQSNVERSDEIGELADAFDIMTLRLRERTEEAAILYAEAIQRNKELAAINARLQSTPAPLIQSDKLASVGQLTAGIVHDVKNPLAVIKGLAEELFEEVEGDGYAREGLATIRDSATKANTIVSDLLKFARESTPEMMKRDMRETIHSVLRLTEYLTRKANVGVIADLPRTPVMATYDAQQIEQVLINMITNATQAMPDGGTIRITLVQSEDEIRMAIKDTGSGISEENLSRIFDPFFTTKPEGEGTGLGLSVSFGIISRHAGTIDVESELNQGTTFTIVLPVIAAREPEDTEVADHA